MADELEIVRAAVGILSLSLDFKTTLESLAKLATTRMADWCGIFVVEPDGIARRLAVATGEPHESTESSAAYPYLCIPVSRGTGKAGFIAFARFDAARE